MADGGQPGKATPRRLLGPWSGFQAVAQLSALAQGRVEDGLRSPSCFVELVGGKRASIDSRHGGEKVRRWPGLKRDRNLGSREASWGKTPPCWRVPSQGEVVRERSGLTWQLWGLAPEWMSVSQTGKSRDSSED